MPSTFADKNRTCVSAACRIQAAASWMQSDDMTYHFSSVAVWASAELACGMLVFSVPAVPKAFANVKVPGWMSSLRSWSRPHTPTQSQQNRRSKAVWTGLGATRPRQYQNIGDGNSSRNIIGPSTPEGQGSVQNVEMGSIGIKDIPAFGAISSTETSLYQTGRPRS